jgi:hypothetical protein
MSRISQSQRHAAHQRAWIPPSIGNRWSGTTKETEDKISLSDNQARASSRFERAALPLPEWWETELGATRAEKLATIRANLKRATEHRKNSYQVISHLRRRAAASDSESIENHP